jgi:hypothetical protein
MLVGTKSPFILGKGIRKVGSRGISIQVRPINWRVESIFAILFAAERMSLFSKNKNSFLPKIVSQDRIYT